MKALVLGCGPAGLLAAERLYQDGISFTIVSRKMKSRLSGAQYLHSPIDGVTEAEPDFQLRYEKVGTRFGYADKVYGDPSAPCSWDQFPDGMVDAWSLEAAYEVLWNRWEEAILNARSIHPATLSRYTDGYDIVFSSLPAPALCSNTDHHSFPSQRIWVVDAAAPMVEPNHIIYNGASGFHWYRSSLINGVPSLEFAEDPEHRWPGRTRNGIKPLTTNCDCNPDITRIGRFGKWQKGVLTHHVWREVENAVLAVQ